MTPLEELLERVRRDSGITDPAVVAILGRVTTRTVEVSARAAMGEDVSQELADLKATALNLEERARNAVGFNVMMFIGNTVTGTLERLLLP